MRSAIWGGRGGGGGGHSCVSLPSSRTSLMSVPQNNYLYLIVIHFWDVLSILFITTSISLFYIYRITVIVALMYAHEMVYRVQTYSSLETFLRIHKVTHLKVHLIT